MDGGRKKIRTERLKDGGRVERKRNRDEKGKVEEVKAGGKEEEQKG